MILTIAQFLIFVTYVGYIIYRFGVLSSISESHYRLTPIKQNYLFTLFCFGLGITMFMQGGGESVFFTLSGIGLLFVGGATQFKLSGSDATVLHFAGAGIGILSALAGLYFEYHMWEPAAIMACFTAICILSKDPNSVFFIEVASFVVIVTGLFLK